MKKFLFILLFLCFVTPVISQSDYYNDRWDNQDYYDYLDDMNDYYNDYNPYDDYDYFDDYDPYEDRDPYYDEYTEENDYNSQTNSYSQKNNSFNRSLSTTKLSPTADIGIFVDLDIFNEYLSLFLSGENIKITDIDSTSEHIAYFLSNGVVIFNALNDFGSIHTIIMTAEEGGDFESYWDTVGWVYFATGLYSSYDNYWEIFEKFGKNTNYESEYFNMLGWFEDSTREFMTVIYPNSERNLGYRNGCDSNYVGACVPITDRNLNCSDIKVKNFFVVGSDKHYLDGNNNGVCCEPYPTFN